MTSFGFAEWLSMIGTFSVVLVLLIFTLVLLKKMGPKVSMSNGRRINIIEAHNLGARQKLLLVSLNGEQVLIGLSPNGITRLAEFDQTKIKNFSDSSMNNDEQNELEKPQIKTSFQQIMSKVIKK